MKTLFEKRISDLKSMGAEIVEVSIPNILDALAAYYIIAPAEASSNLARYDGMRYGLRVEGTDLIDTYKKTRAAGFGDEVQRRMIIGTAVLSSESYDVYFMQAARVRRMIADSFASAFEQCDLIVCPSSAGTAMPLASDLSPLEYYALDLFTVAMNLAGVPACSVPCGLAQNGLPLGMQVVGPRFDDMRVLQLAKHIETAANIDNRPTTIMGK
jgi:aspartyl-tRNA(Asn)/glutamyl-tRNA(Gln) amidotransferase subunit A